MNKDNTQNYRLKHISLGYMVLLFIAQYRTFLTILIGAPLATIRDWLTWMLRRQKDPGNIDFAISTREFVIGVGESVIGEFLSVIGGFSSKNLDFTFCNRTTRDLIKYNWPVYYPGSENTLDRSNNVLVYNIIYKLLEALYKRRIKPILSSFPPAIPVNKVHCIIMSM